MALHARRLRAAVENQTGPLHRTQRLFNAEETARYLGISLPHLRKQHFEGKMYAVEADHRGRRRYSSQDIAALRQILQAGSKHRQYVPRRKVGERLQVTSIVNLRDHGLTSLTLGHGLALAGYRVLMIDLDPHATLTSCFGYATSTDFRDGGTIYDVIRRDQPRPLEAIIRKTHFADIDLAPSGLILSNFQTDQVREFSEEDATLPFDRLALAIGRVEANYDIVLLDIPPWHPRLTFAAIGASSSLILPVAPTPVDIARALQFLKSFPRRIGAAKTKDPRMDPTFLRFLISEYVPNDRSQVDLAALLRQVWLPDVMTSTLVKSQVLSDAFKAKQSIFEMEPPSKNRKAYDAAMQSVRDVLSEIDGVIRAAWGRGL